MSLLQHVAIFLLAAVIAVPLFRWLGLGSVLGYLAAGIALGPWGLKLGGDVEQTMNFAEFGVVLLLFVIGLELQPSRLWVMRRLVFGLGPAQVIITTLLLGAVAVWLGLTWQAALVVGFALSLSSTPLILQLLAERNQLHAHHGRAAFGILLFQDIAVMPVLALLPLLAPGDRAADSGRYGLRRSSSSVSWARWLSAAASFCARSSGWWLARARLKRSRLRRC